MKVKELIEKLKQYPEDMEVGYYATNSYLRSQGKVDDNILDVETAENWLGREIKVVLIGGIR